MTEAGSVLNIEVDATGLFGTVAITATFRPAVDATGGRGAGTGYGTAFLPDGSTMACTPTGTWRKSGHHKV